MKEKPWPSALETEVSHHKPPLEALVQGSGGKVWTQGHRGDVAALKVESARTQAALGALETVQLSHNI